MERLPPWHAEIVDLHEFFTAWLRGELPNTEAAYARLLDTQAPEFLFITPEGERVTGEQLFERFRAGHGSRPGWRMWIERAALLFRAGDLSVVTYEEWHRFADGAVTGRVSTAVLRDKPGTPNGLVWLHVQETWLPEAVQRARAEAG